MLRAAPDDFDGPCADLSVDSALRKFAEEVAQTVVIACLNNKDPVKSLPRCRHISVDTDSLRQELHELQSSLTRQRTQIASLSRSQAWGDLRIPSSTYGSSSGEGAAELEPVPRPQLKRRPSSSSLRSCYSESGRRKELFGFRRTVRNWWYKT